MIHPSDVLSILWCIDMPGNRGGWELFTDGSRIGGEDLLNRVGWGVVIKYNGTSTDILKFRLSDHSTVFAVEL